MHIQTLGFTGGLTTWSVHAEADPENLGSPCCHSVNWLQSPFSRRFSSSGRKRPLALSITMRPSSRISFQFLSKDFKGDFSFTEMKNMSRRTSHNDFQFPYLFKKEIKFLLTFRVLSLLSLETLLKSIKRERQM